MKLHIRHGTLLCLVGLLFSLPSFAQTTTGPFSLTGTGCVGVSVDGQAQVAMNVSGSWSGTIQPEAAIAGQSAANVQVTPSSSSTAASTITANGLYTATVAGYQTFLLCGNTVTGTATVYFSVTQRSASARSSGGGGGGAPTGAAGGDLGGTYPNPSVVKINGTAFSGTNGHLVSFGASNVPADSGVVGANAVVASSPGAGIARFAGGTQAETSGELSGDATTSGSNAVTVVKLNGTTLAALGTGLLKNTTGTGVPSIAVAGDLPATTLATGTSVSLTAPRQYYVCTGTCTITPPVPAAGYEFCVLNTDNVATVITMAAIGSSARYEATARTSYGTAGTGTFISGGAVGDKLCIVGLDSTHYLTTSFTGTWTAN